MKTRTTIVLMLLGVITIGCEKKNKCYTCTSPSASVATQKDYDNGYMPGKEEGCVGQSYMIGSDGVIHHKTLEEVESEKIAWEGRGYKCEW